MPITGVFFIPSNPNSSTVLPTISERLHTTLADEPIPVGRWALEHKLMRDTPSCLPASASQRPAQPRYMQFLSLSYYPFHGFVYASEVEKSQHPPGGGGLAPAQPQPQAQPQPPQQQGIPAQPSSTPGSTNPTPTQSSSMIMTTTSLPAAATLFQHFVYACQPFWCHRHTHAVPGGMVYDVGDFRVRLGDVRQTQPVARVRGTVVEIEYRGPSVVDCISLRRYGDGKKGVTGFDEEQGVDGDDGDSAIDVAFTSIEEADIDAEYAATATLIREFWTRLDIEGAREAILVPDVGKEVKERLQKWRKQQQQQGNQKQSGRGFDGEEGTQVQDEDPDPEAGVDVARQFMEIFRFNR